MKESNRKIRKIIVVVVLLLFVVGFIKILPTFMNLATEEGRAVFETQVKSLGIKGASLIVLLGVIVSNILIILSVKKYGIDFVKDVIPQEKRLKVETMINDNPDRSEITLFVLYFLPVIPKDFITYMASLLPITKRKVLIISVFGRFPAVFSSVLVGSKILAGDVKSIIMIYAITYIISGTIAFVYRRKFAKENRKEKVRE